MKRVILWALALLLVAVGGVFAWGYASDTDPQAMRRKYANDASQFIAVEPGLTVHVRDEGKRDAPVLLLIHGSNSSLHTWEPWVARLGSRYRLVSLDLTGHGLTGPHPRHDYRVETTVGIVDAVMTRLGIPRFAIAGNSMGGWVAWNYALAHQDRLTALILVDASGAPAIKPTALPIGFRIAQTPALRPVFQVFTPRALVGKSFEQSVSVKSVVTNTAVTRYWELLRYPGNRAATGERQRAYPRRQPATREQMAAITVPTLILWGTEDTLTPVAGADWFADAIPGARKIVYDGIGHIPMEEAPDRSAADVDGFLSALPAAA